MGIIWTVRQDVTGVTHSHIPRKSYKKPWFSVPNVLPGLQSWFIRVSHRDRWVQVRHKVFARKQGLEMAKLDRGWNTCTSLVNWRACHYLLPRLALTFQGNPLPAPIPCKQQLWCPLPLLININKQKDYHKHLWGSESQQRPHTDSKYT